MSYNQDKQVLASDVTGQVKWFNPEKGYGFITCDGGQGDVFVHVNSIQRGDRTLNESENVTFDVVQGRKGNEAVNVK